MKKISIIFTIIIASVFLNSCYRDSEEGLYRFVPAYCDTTNVAYASVISAIVSTNCLSCHTGSGAGGGFALDTYAGMKAVVDNGKLIPSITSTSKPMPKTGLMDNCSIKKITAWVNKGAPNN
ncbi:MAG: hypothetical protein ACOYOV_02090 [Bacteroidales bacterium]